MSWCCGDGGVMVPEHEEEEDWDVPDFHDVTFEKSVTSDGTVMV